MNEMNKFAPLIIAWIILVTNAQADLLTFSFEGSISGVSSNQNEVLGPLAIGDRVTGTFAFETDVADTNGNAGSGIFPQMTTASLNFPNTNVDTAGATNQAAVSNITTDSFRFEAVGDTEQFNLGLLRLSFFDSFGSVFDSEDLPTSLDFSDFTSASFTLRGSELSSGDGYLVTGSINNLISVPEPSTFAPVLCGLAFLANNRRRRRI